MSAQPGLAGVQDVWKPDKKRLADGGHVFEVVINFNRAEKMMTEVCSGTLADMSEHLTNPSANLQLGHRAATLGHEQRLERN